MATDFGGRSSCSRHRPPSTVVRDDVANDRPVSNFQAVIAKDQPAISIVIPVYRSVRTLPSVVREILEVFEPRDVHFEILLIDDASGPETWSLIKSLHYEYSGVVRAIRLSRNVGQHGAVLCGLEHARGDLIATIDDDLQHPPREILKLWDEMAANDLDVVYGRYQRKQSLIRNMLGAPLLWWARWAYRVPVLFSPFRLLRQSVARKVTALPRQPMVVIDQLILSVTNRLKDTPVEHRWRPSDDEASSYSRWKLVKLAMIIIGSAPRVSLRRSAIVLVAAGMATLVAGLLLSSSIGWILILLSFLELVCLGSLAWGIRCLARTGEVQEIAETLPYRKEPLAFADVPRGQIDPQGEVRREEDSSQPFAGTVSTPLSVE